MSKAKELIEGVVEGTKTGLAAAEDLAYSLGFKFKRKYFSGDDFERFLFGSRRQAQDFYDEVSDPEFVSDARIKRVKPPHGDREYPGSIVVTVWDR